MRRALAVLIVAAGCGRDGSPPPPPRGPVTLVPAPPAGELAPWIADERARAAGAPVVVYVGAAWCEPCRYFHQAVVDRRLDAAFPGLRLLELDLDRDEARLSAAGYTSQMIPLFALPGPDGRAAGPHIEGSIKGPGAVDEITPRLQALLAAQAR